MNVFARIFIELAQPGPEGETIMIDSTHIKAHRTAAICRSPKPDGMVLSTLLFSCQ